jgi:hypothetical protein
LPDAVGRIVVLVRPFVNNILTYHPLHSIFNSLFIFDKKALFSAAEPAVKEDRYGYV